MSIDHQLKDIAKNLIAADSVADAYAAMQAYKKFLEEYSQLQKDGLTGKADYELANGIAIGTYWAAMCVDDFLRTQRFVKGLYLAIQSRLSSAKRPLRILYAGTGPYATLALPQLALFSNAEVRFQFMEVNADSLAYVQQLMQTLAYSDRIEAFICADATQYQIPKQQQPDIIVTETMQTALLQELQVPITLNLLAQVQDDCVLLPERICLQLALETTFRATDSEISVPGFRVLGNFFCLDKDTVMSTEERQGKRQYWAELQRIEWPENELNNYQRLVVLTEIDIFEDQRLSGYDSGISVPHLLSYVERVDPDVQSIHVQYLIEENPKIDFSFEKK